MDKSIVTKMIDEKQLVPKGITNVMAYGRENSVSLDFLDLKAYEQNSVILLFWNYYDEKALCIHECEISHGQVNLEVAKTLMMQMKYLGYHSMRIAIVYQENEEYVCKYLKNEAATDQELSDYDRWICKLGEMGNQCLIAFWVENGMLSVGLRDTKKFDSNFYKFKMASYEWNDSKFIAYLDAPVFIGAPEMSMCSMSTNQNLEDADINLTLIETSGIKNLYRMEVELSNIDPEDVDGYRFVCNLADHNFKVVTDEDTIGSDDIYYVQLETNDRLGVGIKKKKDNTFILQTGVYDCMLSIVTAVYNTAPFLAEMIDSVLQQDVVKLEPYLLKTDSDDFSICRYKNIYEFILVDDGSTDGSAEIMGDYARIADCIKVIHKENGGVSSARNAGIEIARGKYITFPDSDDKLSGNYLYECLDFFETNEDKITLIATPMKLFDAKTGEHWGNYKFQKNINRVIDLSLEPDASVYTSSSTIMKRIYFKDKLYNESLSIGEDMSIINDFIIDENKGIGVVGKAYYWYRQRSVGEASAMKSSKYKEENYIPVVEQVFERLLLKAQEKYGYIPKHVQYTVMGQLQWRFTSSDKGIEIKELLGDRVYNLYKEKCLSLLRYMDDDVILKQKQIWSEHHYYMLKSKYNINPTYKLENDDISFWFNNTKISTTLGNCYIRLDFLTIKKGILHFEGYAMNFDSNIGLNIYINDKLIEYNPIDRDVNKYSLDEIVFYATTFSVDFDLDSDIDQYNIQFFSKIDGVEIEKRQFRYSKTMPLSSVYSKSYYMNDGWCVRRENREFVVYNLENSVDNVINFEKEFINQICNSKNCNMVQDIIDLRQTALSNLAGKNRNKKIWLISDRTNVAGDNGEALFSYIYKNKEKNIDAYFVINKNSIDFDRMKEIGKVVEYGSQKHYLLHLLADCIISSAADEFVINPWFNNSYKSECLRDFLSKPKFVFLQHGITKDDISGWVNRYNKNIEGFVCSANREAQSILDYDYYYTPKNVWLTGFPRHDRLYHNEMKYITIMPTWRKWLADNQSGNLPLEDFTNSDYFKFYNLLINNNRLLESAQQYGYTICFMPHPTVQLVINLFDKDERVKFFDSEKKYKDIYAESNLVVTDYSSACIDFALLRKPVVYCHFDKEQFFEKHIYKEGYFDYERDGFGEVTYDMDSLIDVIINYMKDDCKVHEPYGSRMDKFFAFHDQNNCERVYQKIKALDN